MAKKMIHLSGLSVCDEANPTGDIEISFTGLRPGEKLYEELLIGDNVSSTSHPLVMRANESLLEFALVEKLVRKIELACVNNDSDALRMLLISTVNEFEPQCGNEDLLI
jgi:FlaA1/EpsC-like NDP-sugar epimerase